MQTEASPAESLRQCPSTSDSDKLDKLSEMVHGLEGVLLDMKKDISLQVSVSLQCK